jgi:hypothetical protein
MAQFQVAPIRLLGLDEKVDKRHTAVGKLLTADNVVIDKDGAFTKRRGYRRIDLVAADIEAVNATTDNCYVGLATMQGELLVFGYQRLYAVVSHDSAMGDDRAIRERGIWLRGNISIHDVTGGIAGNSEPE